MRTAAKRKRPAHLGRLQTLFVKLLFCEQTRAAYCQSPLAVLKHYGLSPEYQKMLPDPDGENFKAEAHGRRMRVWREVFQWFPKTIQMLDEGLKQSAVAMQRPDFNAFLSSDVFINPAVALPAPDGSGPGYESISKFYFWVREVCGTERPGAPVPFRTTVNTEFGLYLLSRVENPSEDYYSRFRDGLYWRETPGGALPLYVLTSEYQLGRIPTAGEFAPFRHLANLDAVVPVGPPAESNIL